ncbi:hypothetical protein Ancab_028443 [Ancistrocladus abbreviatus]
MGQMKVRKFGEEWVGQWLGSDQSYRDLLLIGRGATNVGSIGAEISSSKIKSKTNKSESIRLVKRAAFDSLSRIPCMLEKIYSASPEKEVHRSSDNHATSKEGGPKLAKISCVSLGLRQNMIDHTETEYDLRVQRFSQEKTENKEKAGVSRCSGDQAFQTKDGHFAKTPLRLLFQNQKKLKKYCQKSPCLQKSDREGTKH